MVKEVKYDRVSGGYSLTDAIVRKNVDSGKYVEYITRFISNRYGEEFYRLSCEVQDDQFSIYCNGVKVINNDLEFVDRCRAISVTKFEDTVLSNMKELGFRLKE